MFVSQQKMVIKFFWLAIQIFNFICVLRVPVSVLKNGTGHRGDQLLARVADSVHFVNNGRGDVPIISIYKHRHMLLYVLYNYIIQVSRGACSSPVRVKILSNFKIVVLILVKLLLYLYTDKMAVTFFFLAKNVKNKFNW